MKSTTANFPPASIVCDWCRNQSNQFANFGVINEVAIDCDDVCVVRIVPVEESRPWAISFCIFVRSKKTKAISKFQKHAIETIIDLIARESVGIQMNWLCFSLFVFEKQIIMYSDLFKLHHPIKLGKKEQDILSKSTHLFEEAIANKLVYLPMISFVFNCHYSFNELVRLARK